MNGLATVVAIQSLQFGAVTANTLSNFSISVVILTTVVVVVFATSIVVLFLFWISSKMAVFDVSQKCDVTIRIFKI